MKLRNTFAVAAVAAALGFGLFVPYASATVIFTLGNNPQPGEENILFGAKETGALIIGTTNTTNLAVNFTSDTGQILIQNSSGQAMITTADNGGVLTSMNITLPGFGFNDFIMDPNKGTGTATVTVVTNDGTFTFSYLLGNGQNFLTITTAAGEFISSVDLTVSAGGGFDQFKQPRVSGACTPISATVCVPLGEGVPEPATLALLGLAGLLLAFALRRRPMV